MTRGEKIGAVVALGFIAMRARPAQPIPKPAPGPTPGPPGDGLELVSGQTYEARIKLAGLEATFGTANAVRAKLVGAGFRDVTVTDNKGGNFVARGTWGRATTRAKLPAQVKDVRAVASAPVPLARIYKGPDDAYDVVRMSIETPSMPAREMGIFATRAAAEDIAKKNGWKVAP